MGAPDLGSPQISDPDFARFQRLVRTLAGIHLSAGKKALLVGRLAKRLRARGVRSYRDYYDLAMEDERERQCMVDAVCTNETHFFREPRQFEFLAQRVVPRWCDELRGGRRAPHVRLWSAACSTGEEPYSLAMALLAQLPPGWRLEILASDLSQRALARAREGTWAIAKRSEIPERYLRRYMLRGTRAEEGRMCAGSEIRAVIRFETLNLMDERYAVDGPFDAVFCRNVLIYFEAATKAAVASRLLAQLSDEGLLFLGQAESLAGSGPRLQTVGPSVYARAEGAGSWGPVTPYWRRV